MRSVVVVAVLLVVASVQVVPAEDLVDELTVNDEGDEIIVREARAAKGRGAKGKAAGKDCRYSKGTWSECNPNTNQRTRTLTLKKGDSDVCQDTRVETKKCKKSKTCRYIKGQWSECDSSTNQMERIDNLKSGGDSSCDATQKKVRKCKGKTKKGRH